ncbi:MAG TPA: histidine phosphatase family protein, partial [Candidatus Baltobacteraceae bacterium]|nr:histidine phosphatase family protein [Candidatus Baltobacteraceae bacterium]
MPWPDLLVLVRHAESEGNVRTVAERAAYEVSTHAYPLTARGREQARLTGEWLRQGHRPFDVHYTSYYARAQETMKIMYPDAHVYEDPRLAEANRGIYHTYTEAEIASLCPKELARKKREGLYHHRPLGGENWP